MCQFFEVYIWYNKEYFLKFFDVCEIFAKEDQIWKESKLDLMIEPKFWVLEAVVDSSRSSMC